MPADWLLALTDIAAIVAIAWVGGLAAQRLRQPRIAGEMAGVFLAGLLLGGRIADVVPGQPAEGRNGLPITARVLEDRAMAAQRGRLDRDRRRHRGHDARADRDQVRRH